LNKSLLDTDIFSEITKAANPTVIGHATKQALRQLQNFLTATVSEEVIPFDQPAAELAGRISGDLQRTGQRIGLADPMIAAIALHHGLELVTGNTAHFQRVQQLGYPLTLANWRI
jgi:tRNA(fMet)-specific endonuclease VapC